MCLSPIKIRNNSRAFVSGLSPLYAEVPCGHCAECISSAQNDWYVRLAYEWFYNQKIGGTSLLMTVTYNNANRPYFHVDTKVIRTLQQGLHRLSLENDDVHNKMHNFESEFGFSSLEYQPFSHEHFSHTDISKFLKSLRQLLNNKGLFCYTDSESIKFFCACEYGEKKHKPHYHIIFFLPFVISSSDFMELARYAWSFSVKRADCPDFVLNILKNKDDLKNGITIVSTPNGKKWRDWYFKKNGSHVYVKNLRGNLAYSKKYPPELTSIEGLKYVCKYVNKKDEYMRDSQWFILGKWLQIFPRCLDDYKNRYPDLVEYVKKLRSYFPHVHTSNYLGISILDEFKLLSDDEIAKMCVTPSLSVSGDVRMFNMPSYIVNRVMFKSDSCDKTLRKLTDIGVKVLKYRLDLRVEEFVNDINYIEHTVSQFLTSFELNSLRDFYRVDSLNINKKDLAIYNYFFRNVELPDSVLTCHDINFAFDNYYQSYFDNIINKQYDVDCPPSLCNLTAVAYRHKRTWNYQPCFEGFDNLLEYYKSVRNIFNARKNESRKKKYLEKKYYKDFFNDMLYHCPY